MTDKYQNFDELFRSELNNVDYQVVLIKRNSSVAIISPHGGRIEPGTSEIGAAIASDEYNLYCFEGLRKRPHRDLHITSHRFDEPSCVKLVSGCSQVVALHGKKGAERGVEIAGLDEELRHAICENLVAAGFRAKVVTTGGLAGSNPGNICNRGARKVGTQLEITKASRDSLKADRSLSCRLKMIVRPSLLTLCRSGAMRIIYSFGFIKGAAILVLLQC